MKNLIPILFVMMIVGCGKSLTEEEVIGSYETEMVGRTFKNVFLENGKFVSYQNGEKMPVSSWKIVGKDVHVREGDDFEKDAAVYKIEPNGDLIFFALIRDGKQTVAPKEHKITFKKLK